MVLNIWYVGKGNYIYRDLWLIGVRERGIKMYYIEGF